MLAGMVRTPSNVYMGQGSAAFFTAIKRVPSNGHIEQAAIRDRFYNNPVHIIQQPIYVTVQSVE